MYACRRKGVQLEGAVVHPGDQYSQVTMKRNSVPLTFVLQTEEEGNVGELRYSGAE